MSLWQLNLRQGSCQQRTWTSHAGTKVCSPCCWQSTLLPASLCKLLFALLSQKERKCSSAEPAALNAAMQLG